jgi:hypothetical protein
MRPVAFLIAVALLAVALVAPRAAAQDAPPSTAATPAAAGKCKIVVLNLVGRGLGDDEGEIPNILTDTLAGEVGAVSGCDVVSQADIVAMLDYEQQKAVCTDGNDSCLAEVGQALGADRVVAGTLGKLGADFVLTARLMNVRKGAVESRAEEPVSTGPEKLRRAARNIGRRLFNISDLPIDEKVDATPFQSSAGGANKGGGSSGLLWAGVGIGTIGLIGAGVGGALALVADGKLAEAGETEKDAVQQEGLVALGVAGVGGAMLLTGAILAGVAFME